MTKKIALCRVSDTEPLLSLVTMLEYLGYECVLPDRSLRDYLRYIGCLNVDEFGDMRSRWGAEMPPDRLREVGIGETPEISLYVDVNGFHNGPLVWEYFPFLERKTICYFINGGPLRNTLDKGDGITPACPVITTNQWYSSDVIQFKVNDKWAISHSVDPPPWRDKSYVFYPSFERWDRILPRNPSPGASPVCFCHNVMGWGYGEHVEAARKLGVKFYGGGNSPDGLVNHEDCFKILAEAPCVVYLKGGGAVDYALLEAMATGTPILVPKKYVGDTRLEDLLGLCIHLSDDDLLASVEYHLETARMSTLTALENRRRMMEFCWQPERDGSGFSQFMERQGFL